MAINYCLSNERDTFGILVLKQYITSGYLANMSKELCKYCTRGYYRTQQVKGTPIMATFISFFFFSQVGTEPISIDLTLLFYVRLLAYGPYSYITNIKI